MSIFSGCTCCIGRRQFIASGLAAAATLGARRSFAQAPAAPAVKKPAGSRIDVHHHFLPPAYMKEEHERISFKHGAVSTNALLSWTPRQSLDAMDQNGIATAIVSVTTPGPWFGDVAAGRRLSRMWNDYAAAQIKTYPGRFGIFATMPLPDADGSLAEIAYALDTLKADGIGLLTSYDGKYLGDPSFAPVFAELNRRKAWSTPIRRRPRAAPTPARHAAAGDRISVRDYAHHHQPAGQRHRLTTIPDIRFIFSHGGGATPMLAGRMVDTVGHHPNAKKFMPDGVLAELRKLYYDTAAADTAGSIAALRVMAPLSHILFGTDYPFVKVAEGVKHLQADDMADADRAAIDRGNALALLPRLKG